MRRSGSGAGEACGSYQARLAGASAHPMLIDAWRLRAPGRTHHPPDYVSVASILRRRLLRALIRPHQLRLRQDMTLHRLQELRFGGCFQVSEERVERMELEEVAMPPDRRARTAVTGTLPVVLAVA